MKPVWHISQRSFIISLFIQIVFLGSVSAQAVWPILYSFSPDSGTDQRLITIKGLHLTGVTSVQFGMVPALSFGVADDSTIHALVGAGSSGWVKVSAGVMTDSLPGFTYVPNIPLIRAFSPTTGKTGAIVMITGTHLLSTTAVSFGGTPASSFTVHDDAQVNAFVGNGTSGFVTITNSYGKDSLAGFIFQDSADSPVVRNFNPVSASQGSIVSIQGKYFLGTTYVGFGGVAAASFSIQSDSTILAVVGSGASGEVQVTTGLGIGKLAGFSFTNTLPHIYSFSPDSATTGNQVLIKGKNLLGVNAVSFGTLPATTFNIVNDSVIYATVGNGASGNLAISGSGGYDSLPGFVFIPLTPKIISFSPGYGTSGTVVIIRGFHLSGATAVCFGGVPASFFAIKDDNTVSAFVGAGATGYVSVVTNIGTDSIPGFTYSDSVPKPVIYSFSPISASQGAIVTIRGAHLQQTQAVTFGGTDAASFSVQSDSVLFAVPGIGSSGDITVSTPDGNGTLSGFVYVYTRPYIYSFTPATGTKGNTITITGKNLNGVTSVSFGNTAAASYSIVGDTTISAILGNGSSGNVLIAAGPVSDSLSGFIYQLSKPKIISFSPKIASEGSLVFIQGLFLTGTASVGFGGTPATSFNVRDDNTVTAIVGKGSSGSLTVTTTGGTDSLPGFVFSSGSIQPNPATNQITILFPKEAAVTKVTLKNFNGQELRSVNVSPDAVSATLNVSGIPKGIYVVSWGNDTNAGQQLLIIQ